MKAASVVCVLVALASSAEASPIGKVLEMISDLQVKVIAEGEEAQKVYAEFSELCEERSKDLIFEVKTGKANVADLKAVIGEESAVIDSLTTKVEEVSGSLASAEADLKAATGVREKEATDFAAEEKESTEVIETLGKAIGVIEKGGASMLQLKGASSVTSALSVMVQASALNAADTQRLTALVQNSDASDDDDAGAPAAAGYESQGGGIVETLNGLLEKAQTQLEDARKKESESLQNYELLKQSLTDQIRTSTKSLDKTKKGIASSSEKKATAQGELDVTAKDLSGDVQTLSGVHHDCLTKASDFEAETSSRNDELNALTTAKKVIAEATGGALNQVSFLQVASRATSTNYHVVKFVRHLAQKQHSRVLAQLASKMASAIRTGAKSGSDPFAKIKGLISDMISKLETEAEEGANHKAYCDKELGETKVKQDDKNAEIEKLSTSIEEMAAQSAKLKEEVGTLQGELAKLAAGQAEIDKLRQQENKDYVANKAESEKGLNGIKAALKVLNDYYGKADKAHGSSDGAGGGIIDLLEVIESDFEKELAAIVGEEETAQRAYEQETKQNDMDSTLKSSDVKYKTQESNDLDKASGEDNGDLTSVKSELAAVDEYNTQLKDECIEKASPYEEKAKRREAEIAGLKEAQEILDGSAVLLQQSSSTRTLRGAQPHVSSSSA